MGAHLEIERKFLVKSMPRGWRQKPRTRITQGYFPIRDKDVEVRLRLMDSHHFITIKGGRGRKRLEEEIEVSARRFKSPWPLTAGARISKVRYRIPSFGRTIELDVYGGPYRGFTTADMEFKSQRDLARFRKPDWLGREITGNRRYANEALARSKSL